MANPDKNKIDTDPASLLEAREQDRHKNLDALVELGADTIDDRHRIVEKMTRLEGDALADENYQYKILQAELVATDKKFEKLGKDWADLRRNLFGKDSLLKGVQIIGDPHQEETFERKAKRAQRKRDNAREDLAESEKERVVALADIKGLPQGMSAERQAVALSVDEFVLQEGTSLMAAQNLLDSRLAPFNLTLADSKQKDAIHAVLPPSLAGGILIQLGKGPMSAEYANAMITLKKLQDSIEGPFNELREKHLARNQLQEATLAKFSANKLGDAAREVGRRPELMLAAGSIVVALGMMLWGKKSEGESKGTFKKVLSWLFLGGGVAVLGNAAIKGMTKSHTGPSDWISDRLGFQVNDAISPELLDRAQEALGANFQDKDAADEMIRLMDAPIEKISDVYENASRSGSKSIDPALFLNNGVSAGELRDMNGKSVYSGLDWFFEQCGKRAEAETPGARYSHDELRAQGVKWAKKNLHGCKLATAIVGLRLMDPSLNVTGAMVAGSIEGGRERGGEFIPNKELASLKTEYPLFGESLHPCGTGVYIIQGYPFKYSYNSLGKHVFRDALNIEGQAVNIVNGSDKEIVKNSLDGLIANGAERMAKSIGKKFNTEFADAKLENPNTISAGEYTLKYTPGGYWRFEPGLTHTKYDGLPNYKPELGVPAILHADSSDLYLGLEAKGPSYKTLKEVREAYDKVIMHDLVVASAGHLLLGLEFKVNDVKSAGGKTVVSINYGAEPGHTGTLTYERDKLENIMLQEDAKLTGNWEAEAKKQVQAFFEREDVKREIIKVTPAFAGWTQEAWGKITNMGKWFTESDLETDQRDRRVKQAIRAIYERQNTYVVDYVGALRSAVDVETFNSNRTTLLENTWMNDIKGLRTRAVELEEVPDAFLTAEQVTKMVNTDGKKAIMSALAPLRDQDVTTGMSTFKSLFQTSYNRTIGGDSVRSKLYSDSLGEFTRKLSVACTSKTLKSEVNKEIDKVYKDAALKATTYWGLDDDSAVEQMMLDALDKNASPEWKEATKSVANYLTGNIKWEKFIVFSNPENMARVMQLWYENIENGKLALDPTNKPDATADAYAQYFLWQVSIRMGGHRDWSPDRFYDNGGVFSNSDSQFNDEFGSLSRGFQKYSVWSDAVVTPKIEGTTTEREAYVKIAKERFKKWFDTYADCGGIAILDAEWPAVFEGIVNKRLENVIAKSSTADLGTRIENLKDFVLAERFHVFEPMMLHKIEHTTYGFNLETTVFNEFDKYFYGTGTPPTNAYDLIGYEEYLKGRMLANNILEDDGIITNFYDFPNWPNIPYATLRGAPTLP